MANDGREGGYIKLYRRLKSWSLWKAMSCEQRGVWIEMLMSANWKDDEAWYGTRRYIVRRGQLSHSEETIAREAKVGRQVVRSTISRLIAEGAVLREKAFSGNQAPWLITIANYERFQGMDEDDNPQKNQALTRLQPSSNQEVTLREEGEEREEGKKILPRGNRKPLLGLGSPAWEALEYWKRTVWPSVTTSPCSEPSPHQVSGLAGLCSMVGVAEVKARMDRAAADPYWKARLTLDDIVDRFDRFAQRVPGATTDKPKVTAAASERSAFGKGEVVL